MSELSARQWPYGIPADLRDKLDKIARYRTPPESGSVWLVVKEWLEAHEVEPPENPQGWHEANDDTPQ